MFFFCFLPFIHISRFSFLSVFCSHNCLSPISWVELELDVEWYQYKVPNILPNQLFTWANPKVASWASLCHIIFHDVDHDTYISECFHLESPMLVLFISVFPPILLHYLFFFLIVSQQVGSEFQRTEESVGLTQSSVSRPLFTHSHNQKLH